jgi:putative phosphoribosyl transferase
MKRQEAHMAPSDTDVLIPAGHLRLRGRTDSRRGGRVVVFAHGSGSGMDSPRNRAVADRLHEAGCATLLFDLLTPEEIDEDRRGAMHRFDLPLLVERLRAAVDWASSRRGAHPPRIGLFGASTGAAAALSVAARRPDIVRAVVSRGGRVDLALDDPAAATAATLLIVGEHDEDVLALNHEVLGRLGGECRLIVVPGAGHLFEEPGALERVADEAGRWFATHLGS